MIIPQIQAASSECEETPLQLTLASDPFLFSSMTRDTFSRRCVCQEAQNLREDLELCPEEIEPISINTSGRTKEFQPKSKKIIINLHNTFYCATKNFDTVADTRGRGRLLC